MIAQSKPNRVILAASVAFAGAALSGCIHERGPRDRYFESRRDIAPSWVNPDMAALTTPPRMLSSGAKENVLDLPSQEHPIETRSAMSKNFK